MPAFSVSAPGKTILFGEHAVVYGHHAIAVPLFDISLKVSIQPLPNKNKILIINSDQGNRHISFEKKEDNPYWITLETIRQSLNVDHLPSMEIAISSSIPVAAGLGSSAAFSVALTKAVSGFLGFNLPVEKLNSIAFEIEKHQHGSPSGIDNTVVAYQSPVYYRKNEFPIFFNINKPMHLILADSGIRSLTKDVVLHVKQELEKNPDKINKIFAEIEKITIEAKGTLETGDHRAIGNLMLDNHIHLQRLGVSIIELDCLVEAAVESGAFGAKLCGSGQGGNVVALTSYDKTEKVIKAMRQAGAVSCLRSTIQPTKVLD